MALLMANAPALVLRERGITLLELLISLSISAILLLAFVQFFASTTRMTIEQRNRMVELLEVNLVLDQIESDVRTSMALSCNDGNHPLPVSLPSKRELIVKLLDLSRKGAIESALGQSVLNPGDAEPFDILRSLNCYEGVVHVYGSDPLVDPIVLSVCDGSTTRPCITRRSQMTGSVYAEREVRWQLRDTRISRFDSAHPLTGRGAYVTVFEPVDTFEVQPILDGYEVIGVKLTLGYREYIYQRDIRW